MTVGESIKKYIEQSGVTQKHIAKQVGISVQSLNAICNGKQRLTAEQYFAICDSLGVSCEYFKRLVDSQRRVSAPRS